LGYRSPTKICDRYTVVIDKDSRYIIFKGLGLGELCLILKSRIEAIAGNSRPKRIIALVTCRKMARVAQKAALLVSELF